MCHDADHPNAAQIDGNRVTDIMHAYRKMGRIAACIAAAILTTLAIATYTAAEGNPAKAADAHWRIISIPLDQPMDDQYDLDGQYMEGLYEGDYGTKMAHNFGGYIGPGLKSSGLDEAPFYHIDSTMKDGRDFELWFSSAEDGRKVFGVRLNLPYSETRTERVTSTIAEVRAAFGAPDLEFTPADMPAQTIIVIADRMMPKPRYDAVV